ncbi:aminotransferase class V-fold PLP-dependent enzyme, partial [candidate division WOR-3 bacterium]|nr:aminotransferase class V-fold PLP-dependent enzyme [candidate division WOR-3 bacterium]
FPANTVPWEMNLPDIEKKRVPVNPVDSLEERIISSIDEKTRAVALDWVDFYTGYRIDLDAVSGACAEHDAFLVVDGIQGCGALHLDLSKVHVDFFSANSAKWLLGPVGSGLLYVNSKTVPKLKSAFRGWMSLEWSEFNHFDPLPPLKQGAGRFEAGSYAGILLSGFKENLKLLNSIGITEIERRVLALRNRLLQSFRDMGADIISPPSDNNASGILTFRFAEANNSALFNHLSENKVKASLREDSIRLSPHFYNTLEEVEKVVGLIKDFLYS